MTGGGSASVAFAKADGFLSIPSTPTYYSPGIDISISDLSLDNALERLRLPDQPAALESVKGQLEGAFAAEWVVSADVHADVRDIVFNDGGTGFSAPGPAATSRWYLGLDYLDTAGATATAERVLKGVVPTEFSLSYSVDQNTVRASLTAIYADEELNTAVTPGSVTGPTADSAVPFHGFDLSLDGATVEKLQSATLSISNIARLQRDAEPTAVDAVIAAPETTLDLEAIVTGTERTSLAYGSPGATTTEDTLTDVSGTITLTQAGSTLVTASLPRVTPATYEWNDLVATEDTTESVTFNVDDGVTLS